MGNLPLCLLMLLQEKSLYYLNNYQISGNNFVSLLVDTSLTLAKIKLNHYTQTSPKTESET